MAEAAIQMNGVSAGYGETVVLEDINLTVSSGESLSVIGRNGVGKTTLLATIMGHTTLHGGHIRLHGNDISKAATYRRVVAGLGYVPQEREIFPSLTLRENLDVAARPGSWTIDKVFALFPRLAERAESRHDLETAIGYTRQQAALDPLAEEPQRQLMRRLAAAGDRAAAIRAYQRFSQRLRDELRIVPSHATRSAAPSVSARGGTTKPVSPSDTNSSGPPESSVVKTGLPERKASSGTYPRSSPAGGTTTRRAPA